MTAPENSTETAFVRWCKEKHQIKARKLLEQKSNGFPDRSIILPGGRLVCIEFKSPTGDLRPAQKLCIKELRNLDIPVLVMSDLEEAKAWLLEQL